MIKKADIILLILIVIAGLAISFGPLAKQTGGNEVVVSVDGERYGVYSLYEDRTITVETNGHRNVIVIDKGQVYMEASSCENQVCVNKGRISLKGDSIVCLPNKLTVEIRGNGGEVDVISG